MTRFAQIATRKAREVAGHLALVIAGTSAALLVGMNPATAQINGSYAGTQFEIELVVFSRAGGMQQARETWPATPQLGYSENWLDFQSPADSDPTTLALQPVAGTLDNKVAALSRDSQYTVLFHKTWRQVLQEERNAPAILISGGPQTGDHHALEGSVTLSVSRYLHLSTDLWLSEFDSNAGAANLDTDGFSPTSLDGVAVTGILVPRRPQHPIANWPNEQIGNAADEPMDLAMDRDRDRDREGFGFNQADKQATRNMDAGMDAGMNTGMNVDVGRGMAIATGETTTTPAYAQRVAVLQEERRLRSGELHYIDHPKFGVLIEVRTVKPLPEAVAE